MALPNDQALPVGNTGKFLRTFEETVNAKLVQVEALSIADPQVVNAVATVLNAAPGVSEYGLTVRIAGTVQLAASPTIDIGKVDQGLQGTIAQSWFVELTDGTNVLGSAAHPVVVSVNGTAAVSGTVAVSNFPATQAVSGTVTANLGTTGTLVTDANLDEKFGDLGQKNMAGSAPVVIASDQAAIPISGSVTTTPSGTQDVNLIKVDGTAMDVNTGNASAGTQRVVLATNQPAVAVSGTVAAGSVLDGVNVNQQTSNTSAVQITASSIVPGNGVLVQALSTNAASVFIGGASVTTGTGYELQAGQAVPFTPTNVNLLYVIGANNTDKVCWNSL